MLTAWIAKKTPRAVLVITVATFPVLAFVVMAESFHCAKEDFVRMDLGNLDNAARSYRHKKGAWPSESGWSEELLRQGLVEGDPVDAWGHAYRYRLGVRGGESVPSFRSIGPDGADWTEDDLTSVPSTAEQQQCERDQR